MTLQEWYQQLGGDYDGTVRRLPGEKIVRKFILKYPTDDSYKLLCQALQNNDVREAFRSAHTLKGVALNLGFTGLHEVSSDMTELLREESRESFDSEKKAKAEKQLEKIRQEQERTITLIHDMEREG